MESDHRKPPNGFELSGQGYDHSGSILRASLARCSEWLADASWALH